MAQVDVQRKKLTGTPLQGPVTYCCLLLSLFCVVDRVSAPCVVDTARAAVSHRCTTFCRWSSLLLIDDRMMPLSSSRPHTILLYTFALSSRPLLSFRLSYCSCCVGTVLINYSNGSTRSSLRQAAPHPLPIVQLLSDLTLPCLAISVSSSCLVLPVICVMSQYVLPIYFLYEKEKTKAVFNRREKKSCSIFFFFFEFFFFFFDDNQCTVTFVCSFFLFFMIMIIII